ncbi:MAG TPA: protein kinase [Nocardioidaceae bacterium]|nr:protein kinase [Nocardioidaceae bacterium]
MPPEAPLLADRYRLESILGRGGMGQVWRGFDEVLRRPVAVKEVRFPAGIAAGERDALCARMLREARLTARLNHPNVTTTYDVVEQNGQPYIVMELVEAASLSDEIERNGTLTAQRTAEIGLELLKALGAAHRLGIVHRDVKPSNVLLADDGRVVLTDFGIATSEADPSLTSTGLVIGSPTYMSPERLRGERTGAPADIWSLGATLYSAVQGLPPFSAPTTMGMITAVLTDDVPPPDGPAPLRSALLGMLEKDPVRRLQGEQVQDLLRQVLTDPARESPMRAAPVAGPDAGDVGPTSVKPPTTVNPVVSASGAPLQSGPPEAPAGLSPAAAGFVPPAAAGTGVPGAAGTNEPVAVWHDEPAVLWHSSTPPDESSRLPGTRTMKIALALLALVAVLVAGYLLLPNLGDTTGNADGTAAGNRNNDSARDGEAAGDGTGSGNGGGANAPSSDAPPEDTTTDAEDTPSSDVPTTPIESSTSATTTAPTTTGDAGSAIAPEGYKLHQDELGFNVAIPKGWERRVVGEATVDFVSPDGTTFLRVDQRAEAGPDAVQAWYDLEPEVADRLPGYERVGIEPIEYRGWEGADWEFTWEGSNGTIHVLDRALIVPPKGWALYVSSPDATWSSEGLALVDNVSRTFQPTS